MKCPMCDDMRESILSTFEHKNPFNFHNELLPFCPRCREIVVKLCLYKSEMVTIQKKITKTVGIVTKLIIDSTLAASAARVNQSNQDNCNYDEQKCDEPCIPLTATVMSTEDEEVCRKISRYRQSIIKKYSPFVNLHEVERIMKNPSNSVPSSFQNDENPLTQLGGHADLGPSDPSLELTFDEPTLEEPFDNCDENLELFQDENVEASFLVGDSQGEETDKDQVILNQNDNEFSPADDDDTSTKISDNNLEIVKPPEMSSMSLIEQIRSKSQQQLMEHINSSEFFLYFERWPVQRKGCLLHCLTCGEDYTNTKHLFHHMKLVHRDPRTLCCPTCKVEISNENNFISHQRNVHPDTILVDQIIACGHSRFLYDGRRFFDEQENGFQCSLCGTEKENRDGILSHLQTHKDAQCVQMVRDQRKTIFDCGMCRLIFKTFEEKIHHLASVHPRNCRCCGQSVGLEKSQAFCEPCKQTKLKVAETSFVCPLCRQKCKQKPTFLHHFSLVHPEVRVTSEIIECGNGNLLVDGSWLFFKNEENDDGFQCCFCCDRTIEGRESIRQHLENHPGHMCEVCGLLTKDQGAMSRHRYEKHQHQYSEDPTSGKFYAIGVKYAHYEHQVDATGIETGFKCSECDFFGQDHSQMSTHILGHKKDKRYKRKTERIIRKTIKGADGVFIYDGKWKFKDEHNGEFKCLTCGRICIQKQYVERHIRQVHERRFRGMCDFCGKIISAKYFKDHLAKHSNVTPFKCSLCDCYFKTKNSLSDHNRKRHKVKVNFQTYTCDQCQKVFKTKAILTNHQIVHSEEKKYKCPHCPKTFKQPSGCDRHKKTHASEKPYACPKCPMRFTQSQNVGRHVKVVHSEARVMVGEKPKRIKTREEDTSEEEDTVSSSAEEIEEEIAEGDNQNHYSDVDKSCT